MLIFRKVNDLQSWVRTEKADGKSIGFVPTMGALHTGHISLISTSQQDNEITVCSIFVNPTQFNDPKDLEKYPRTLEADTIMLADAKCDLLFFPSVEEIYPPDLKEIEVDLQGLDTMMEGAHRPGHFKGVVQVVHRLLDIVKPDHLYMGQKDFQQFSIIAHMINELKMPVKLNVCPILRESNMLAQSSRNERLSPEGRERAGKIYNTISRATLLRMKHTPAEVCKILFEELNHEPFQPEYVEIVDQNNLTSVNDWNDKCVICIAVWLEGIRLIDNIIL
ncbi:MAG: pantoate--beta-alanine ligase [Saprospiraceae bacterium]